MRNFMIKLEIFKRVFVQLRELTYDVHTCAAAIVRIKNTQNKSFQLPVTTETS